MTGSPSGGERRCPDDLVVRGQREPLTDLERQVLAAHLAQCAECRGAAALAALFDAVPDVHASDDALIARVADRAARAPRRIARWPRWQVAAAIAMLLTCGGATAAWMTYRQSPRQEAPLPAPRPEPSAKAPRRSPHIAPLVSPSDQPPAANDRAEAPSQPQRRPRPQPVATAVPATPPPPSPTAAEMFAEANALRRKGDTRQAVALYQSLRHRFPGSSQALLSAISVGDLLLADDPAGAVAAYSAYLRDSPNGSLTEEALFGRARGLRTLGRVTDERQAWQELSRRFPRSPYQPTASRRLRELAP